MLKTLRVTSLVTVILAAVGVVTIVALGLKGDPAIREFLAKAGIVEELRSQIGQTGTEEDKSPPLVALAKGVALRFDPPPPPRPVVPDKPPAETARVAPRPAPVTPRVQMAAKFDLLATVVYETAPEKSLALLKTTSNVQEWFRQGEKAGHLEIEEIRNGSVVFTQAGGQSQEVFVPAKPQIQALLKGERSVSTARPGSITDSFSGLGLSGAFDTEGAADVGTGSSETTPSGRVRMVRPRADISERIQRVRSTPQPPPPKEQKKQLDQTVSGIEALMKRQDDLVSAEERKKENEMWMRLLEELNAEKEMLDAQIQTSPPAETDEKTDAEQSEENTDAENQEIDKSVSDVRE